MEDKILNEKESLELISRMIKNSKKNLQAGSGNMLLLWGYLCAVTSIVIYVLFTLTGSPAWNWLWLVMLAAGIAVDMRQKKNVKPVSTYLDKVLAAVWQTVGGLGTAAAFVLCVQWGQMMLMLPSILIIFALGVCITGNILEDKWMRNAGIFCFALGIGTLAQPSMWISPYIIFAVCFVLMMIIPGHRLNREAKREALN